MSPPVGLLDTSAFLNLGLLGGVDGVPDQLRISAITLAELAVGPLVVDDPVDQARRQAHLQLAEIGFDALPFNADAARAFGRVAASLRKQGRTTNARAYDAMIAATALARGLPVLTFNRKDFDGIDGLQVIDLS